MATRLELDDTHKRIIRFLQLFLRPDLHRDIGGATAAHDQLAIYDAHLEHLEFEVRLCKPSDGLSAAVDTNIPDVQWQRMLGAVRTMLGRDRDEAPSVQIVQRFGRTNENITSMHALDPRVTPVYRMKRKLGTLDLMAKGTPFDVRIAASLELPVRNAPSDTLVTERLIKRRWSFVFFDTLRCDFTQLETTSHANNAVVRYEHQVEIELLNAAQSVRDGVCTRTAWSQIDHLVRVLAEAADTERCEAVQYSIIRQRLNTRVAV
jgi:hypothetical protein